MFLPVQLFTSAIVAVATWLAFRALGVQQAAVWGLLAGIFNSIPYFGPVIVTGCTSVVAFLQFGTIAHGAHSSSAVSLVITSLEGFLLTPMADEPRGADERGRDLRRAAVLGLGVERVGDAARGPDADGDQDRLRSRRRLQERRRAAGD